MTFHHALGLGIGTLNSKGQWLEVFFPAPQASPKDETVQGLAAILGGETTAQLTKDQLSTLAASGTDLAELATKLQGSSKPVVAVLLKENAAPKTVPEAYLKLHLLSHRLVRPHGTVLDGIFGVLPNVAWTSQGAIDPEELEDIQLEARMKGEFISVDCVDKFPKMTNYVVPKGVRIAHTARVRLGAYLGAGTTVMHEGFVNFNGGTVGKSMIEGRISAGVMVGENSDLGGGCSTMGTLSGGGNMVISVGEKCLIGANGGTGIPLGDRCTVEAGLYVTAGTKVVLLDDKNQEVKRVKARDLAGKSDLLFRRNSLTGAVECKTNKNAVALNEELHAN
ncbi:MAG: 2,3,4,5-tetrahydropyridine-2,6-dicarboxylate N-succinyltransferase [Planctomycetota bacterium]|nr:2,3,4,5-tetrahydropyridine-2,6-dicarboxylate N-succinyltransferase [Planctomycetota bacterium]